MTCACASGRVASAAQYPQVRLNSTRSLMAPLGDPIAEGGDGQALVPAPHGPVSGGWVMVAVVVTAEEGDVNRTGKE